MVKHVQVRLEGDEWDAVREKVEKLDIPLQQAGKEALLEWAGKLRLEPLTLAAVTAAVRDAMASVPSSRNIGDRSHGGVSELGVISSQLAPLNEKLDRIIEAVGAHGETPGDSQQDEDFKEGVERFHALLDRLERSADPAMRPRKKVGKKKSQHPRKAEGGR